MLIDKLHDYGLPWRNLLYSAIKGNINTLSLLYWTHFNCIVYWPHNGVNRSSSSGFFSPYLVAKSWYEGEWCDTLLTFFSWISRWGQWYLRWMSMRCQSRVRPWTLSPSLLKYRGLPSVVGTEKEKRCF